MHRILQSSDFRQIGHPRCRETPRRGQSPTGLFVKDPELESLIFDDFFLSRINRYQEHLRKTTGLAVSSGLPVPAFFNAVSYLDSFRAKASGANLIQAQRDFFGAHTFERTDRKGIFHHEWRAGHEV